MAQLMVNGIPTVEGTESLHSRGRSVEGTVVDDEGTPINGGKIGIVEINDADPYSRYWVIDGSGQFSLRLHDGDYIVTAINQ